MSDVAQAAQVSQGTLYHYYSSKDDLFMSLFSTWAEQMAGVVTEISGSPTSAAEKLEILGQIGLAYLQTDEDLLPVFVEFWAYALHNPKATKSFRNLFQAMQQTCAEIIEQGIASAEFKEIDVEIMSSLPLVVLDGVVLLSLLVGKDVIEPEQLIRQTLHLVLTGLLAEG
jgi:AcrR family transcriptional regulator